MPRTGRVAPGTLALNFRYTVLLFAIKYMAPIVITDAEKIEAHYLLHYAYSVVVTARVEEETGFLTMILNAEGTPVLIIDAMDGSPL